MRIYSILQGIQSCHFVFAPLQPSGGAVYRRLHIFPACHTGGAFIKSHSNGRTQVRLNLHTFLRSHENFSAVNMGIEVHALFLNLSQFCQRKYLKSAGIRKNGAVPVHKLVQPSQLFNNMVSRTHMKMIGIG